LNKQQAKESTKHLPSEAESRQPTKTNMKNPLPIPDQLEKQLAKCKSIRDADSYYKSRDKTPQVRGGVVFLVDFVGAWLEIELILFREY
jgi:hypothetical protein